MRHLPFCVLATASLMPGQFGLGGVPEAGLATIQRLDGSWVDDHEPVVAVGNTKRPGSELRTTSLVVISDLGDGSTIRSGHYKKRVR